MKNSNSLWVICGSDLYTGQVLYLSSYDQTQLIWSTDITSAVGHDEKQDATKILIHVKQLDQTQQTVDPYLVQTDMALLPLKKREQMRIDGPSIAYQKVGTDVSI